MRPAESLHRPDMKDVGFEEPVRGVGFDLKRDVLPNDCQGMRGLMDVCRKAGNWTEFAYVVCARLDCDPTFHLQTEMTAADLQSVRRKMTYYLSKKRWTNCANFAPQVRRLDPDYNCNQFLDAGNYLDMAIILDSTYPRQNMENLWRYASLAWFIKSVEPTFDLNAEVTAIDRHNVRKALDNFRQTTRIQSFARLARTWAQIDPHFDVAGEITDADWEEMRKKLGFWRGSGRDDKWVEYTALVSDMVELSRRAKTAAADRPGNPFPTIKTY